MAGASRRSTFAREAYIGSCGVYCAAHGLHQADCRNEVQRPGTGTDHD
jgi:hypothetical protein